MAILKAISDEFNIPIDDIINGEDMIVRMFQRIWEERAFFRNAFQDKSQNSLSEYILEFYIKQEIEVLCR